MSKELIEEAQKEYDSDEKKEKIAALKEILKGKDQTEQTLKKIEKILSKIEEGKLDPRNIKIESKKDGHFGYSTSINVNGETFWLSYGGE